MLTFILGLFESETYSTLHHLLIVLHVAAALLALVIAPGAMIAAKGGRAHRNWGRIYFWAMVTTNLLALWLLFWRFNLFLFGVTLLSLYGVLIGYRTLRRKRGQVRWFDWALSWAVFTSGVGLVAWGLLISVGIAQQFVPANGSGTWMAAVLSIAFGSLLFSDARKDLRLYRAPSPDHRWWWYHHMDRMLGSYIALLTALMVQQVAPRLPESMAWVAWVVPAAVGTPLISLWIARYRTQFATKRHTIATEPVLSEPALSEPALTRS